MSFICDECKKEYKSYQSLWNHNKKFHSIISGNSGTNGGNISSNINTTKKYICNICEKEYNNKYSKYKHQQKCSNDDLIKKAEVIGNAAQTQIQKLETKINQLEKKVNKKSNKKIINNNNTNNGTIINNIVINKIGSENLLEFNDNEITQIFNKELEGIVTFIELLNFNERLPQNHSYCTTSLESKYLSTYNKETNTIEKDRKKYFFDKLLNTTIDRIQILYNSNKGKFNKMKQKQIEENITNLKSLKNYDFNNKILKEMINKMNLVTYNKRQIIQKTWHEDSDSDDDFQRDLEKETKEEFYKKIAMKEKLALEYEAKSETISSSSVKKLEIKPKPKKFVLKHDTVSSSESEEEQSVKSEVDSNIFLEIYENK
jgi:hypothetical protein